MDEILKKVDSRIAEIGRKRELEREGEKRALSLLQALMERAGREGVHISLLPLAEGGEDSFDSSSPRPQPLVIEHGVVVVEGERGPLGWERLLEALLDPRKRIRESILPILYLALEDKVEIKVEEE